MSIMVNNMKIDEAEKFLHENPIDWKTSAEQNGEETTQRLLYWCTMDIDQTFQDLAQKTTAHDNLNSRMIDWVLETNITL